MRDRALFFLAFSSALRRINVVELRVCDVELREQGVLIHVRRSKTDQEERAHVNSRLLNCPTWFHPVGDKSRQCFDE